MSVLAELSYASNQFVDNLQMNQNHSGSYSKVKLDVYGKTVNYRQSMSIENILGVIPTGATAWLTEE